MPGQDLTRTMERADEAWKKRWRGDDSPRSHSTVKVQCGLKELGEIVGIVSSLPADNVQVSYACSETPRCVLEFDCTWNAWEVFMNSLKSVPTSGKWYHQEAIEGAGK